MRNGNRSVRVVYSFPHKLGADRICYSAWQQVNGAASAGADIIVFPGVLHMPVQEKVKVFPTLSWGKLRISYKLIGTLRACILHDFIVSHRIKRLGSAIDIIHTWPLGALRTLKVARELGIPTVLERPNAHTRYAYEVVQRECDRLGVPLPSGHEHAYNEAILRREEKEYQEAFRILCPSEFVERTFVDNGFRQEKLLRNMRGFDAKRFYPQERNRDDKRGLTVLFVGVCAVRKGLHYALEAWLRSPAHREGTFRIAGEFLPAYAEKLSSMLSHPSVKVLGHRNDVHELMRQSDILILPSLEEGSAKATSEGRASGCVLLVSEAAGATCEHMENALIHRVGDVEALTKHLTILHEDRELLERLRSNSLRSISEINWEEVGIQLLQTYRDAIGAYHEQ